MSVASTGLAAQTAISQTLTMLSEILEEVIIVIISISNLLVIGLIICNGSLSKPSVGDESQGTIYIYVSTYARNEADGTRIRPYSSLSEANEHLINSKPESNVEVRVIGNEGKYIDQKVVWTYYSTNYYTKIVGYPNDIYAEFQASMDNPPLEPFFKLIASNGEQTNIILEGLRISNYVSRPILFMGDRENRRSGWNGNNRIINCKFIGIGNNRMPNRHMVYSAVGLNNSRNNLIEQCEFIDLANANVGGYPQNANDTLSSESIGEDLPIIGIYLAHNSYNNIIINNKFSNVKGDCIRIRDYSNENVIENNYFYKCGWKAICTMWYCNKRSQTCGKMKSECPSYENVLRNNKIFGNWICEYPKIFLDLQTAQVGNCMRMNPTHNVRIYIQSNDLFECE